MATKHDLKDWIVDALRAHGGRAPLIAVAKHIWQHHEPALRQSGDLFYKWQYDMRWAATELRQEGRMGLAPKSEWQLLKAAR